MTTTDDMKMELTPVRCVDCWIERELIRTAAFMFEGMSCCSRHMMARKARRDGTDTVEG